MYLVFFLNTFIAVHAISRDLGLVHTAALAISRDPAKLIFMPDSIAATAKRRMFFTLATRGGINMSGSGVGRRTSVVFARQYDKQPRSNTTFVVLFFYFAPKKSIGGLFFYINLVVSRYE